MKIDKFKVREQNASTVLQEIIKSDGISRVELANLTGLNKTSITSIISNLLNQQVVIEKGTGKGNMSGGRKPILIHFNEKAGVCLLVNIDTGFLECTASYLDQQIILQNKLTDINITKDNIFETLTEMIETTISQLPETELGVIGLTVAIHGSVNHQKIAFTPRSNIDQVDLYNLLQDKYDFAIHIENEVNLSTFGEYAFASPSNYLINLSVRNGVRAGIIKNGILQKGRHGNAGEIGHTIIKENGRPCVCGNAGCLEQYTSLKAIYRQFGHLKHMDFVNMIIIREFYRTGDLETVAFIDDIVSMLSRAINNLIVSFDPDIITLNGDLFKELPEICDLIQDNLKSAFTQNCVLRNSTFHEQASILGATALNLQEYFNIPNLKYNHIEDIALKVDKF